MTFLNADEDTDICDIKAVDARFSYPPGLHVMMVFLMANACFGYDKSLYPFAFFLQLNGPSCYLFHLRIFHSFTIKKKQHTSFGTFALHDVAYCGLEVIAVIISAPRINSHWPVRRQDIDSDFW
ncbi:hypothetical protein QBC45DRAFT_403485 [Copromyces sp. CBS 386.78]|nr:hypothetical protein QBC45DRAFT_403485 [Copromyces sp. CBS 386.78]